MPIPKPKKYERKNKYISRCVSEDTMEKEFKNIKQRLAVCYSKLKSSKK